VVMAEGLSQDNAQRAQHPAHTTPMAWCCVHGAHGAIMPAEQAAALLYIPRMA
jgi:hypothetical protein